MKKIVIKGVALFVALFSSSLFALPLKQAKLTVSGYQGGETTLENFPLLVRISPERISGFSYGDCALDGSDISFALENGEILPHEIDTWVNGGESLVWVRLPALQGTETSFYFRWNDSGPAENISANVWSADYAGVWHMNGASGVTLDSTGHELHATPKVAPNSADASTLDTYSIGVAGKVGTARQTAENGKGGYLSVSNHDSLSLGGTFVVSGWVYLKGLRAQHRLIGHKSAWNTTDGWEVELRDYSKVRVRGASGAEDKDKAICSPKDKWVHLAFVYNESICTIYTNGFKSASASIAAPKDNSLPLSFGCGPNGTTGDYYIRGYFDEFRLKDGVPSAEWIKAEYDSMESDNFITYATAEDITIGSVLMISGEPSRIGSPEPAYGTIDNLTPGQSLTLSQPSLEVPGEGTVTNYLKGWTLESLDVVSGEKTLLRSSSDEGVEIDVCNYVHNSPAVMTWLWEARDQLGVKNFFLVENGGNHLKFSVDVTGIGYTASSATLKLRYGITPDNFIWTHVVDQAVEKCGVLEMTLPNTIPGVYYYVKASIETNEDKPQVVETEVIKIQADPSVAGEDSSSLENVVLDASLGNKLTVRGALASESGGTLTVLVGDSLETITNVWTQLDGSSLSSAGEFSLTLGDAEPGSSRYLAPGSKYYVLVMVETSDGEVFISPAQSVTTPPSTSWTYYETATNHNGIGSGYITDGVWKLSANRRAKNSLNLYATASGGAFYGVKSCVYPINLTVIHSKDKSEFFAVTFFGRISHRNPGGYLYNSKERLSEFIAPHCTALDGGINNGYNFNGCTSLTNVVLNEEGVSDIPQNAFSDCSALVDISPRSFKNCTYLYSWAFSGCGKLAGKLDFPLITSIGEGAFNMCKALEEVSVPAVTNFGPKAFFGCSSIGKLVFKTPIAKFQSNAFYGIKPGAEVYMHKEPPTDFGALAVARLANGNAYPRIYLKGNEEAWLNKMRENNTVILKEDFNAEATLKTYAKYMVMDGSLCRYDDLKRVELTERGVVGFLYKSTNEGQHGAWIFGAPKGFSILVR